MAFGQLAPMRGREESRREGKALGLSMEDSKECFSMRRLIVVFVPLAEGALITGWSCTQLHTHLWVTAPWAACLGEM